MRRVFPLLSPRPMVCERRHASGGLRERSGATDDRNRTNAESAAEKAAARAAAHERAEALMAERNKKKGPQVPQASCRCVPWIAAFSLGPARGLVPMHAFPRRLHVGPAN